MDIWKTWGSLALIFLLMVACWVVDEFVTGLFKKKGGEKDGEDQ